MLCAVFVLHCVTFLKIDISLKGVDKRTTINILAKYCQAFKISLIVVQMSLNIAISSAVSPYVFEKVYYLWGSGKDPW